MVVKLESVGGMSQTELHNFFNRKKSMTETNLASSNGPRSRTEKVSAGQDGYPRRIGDLHNEGEVKTFQFEGCSESFGIVLENRDVGSTNRSRSTLGNIRIAKLLSGCPAGRDKSLRIGDRVLEINGHDLNKASIERARWYLGRALRSGKITITVMHDGNQRSDSPLVNDGVIPSEATDDPAKLKNAVKKIHILKDSRGLGVQISLKVNRVTGESGVFVSDVNPGGAAAKDGRLKEGDELLSINGHSLIGVTQQHAIDLLRASPKLIQIVISTQDEESSVEGNGSLRHLFESHGNMYTKGIKINQMTRKVPQASSVDNVLNRNKVPLDKMGKRHSIDSKPHRIYKNGSPKNGKQLLESDHSRTADTENYNGHIDTKEQNSVLVKKNSSNTKHTITEHQSSVSSSENIVPSKLHSEDVLFSKAEESPDSEPAVLEDKPVMSPVVSNTASSPDFTKKEHSMMPLPIESSGTGKNDKRTGRGLLSPLLPRLESPNSLGIAFPARYIEDISSNITTVGLPTPNKIVGSNERDSPQADRRGNVDVASRKISKGGEEVELTVVLVKGMNGKGLGFTIVGGKGSRHGDMPVYVKSILSGGKAEADGRLRRGDELLSINGTSLQGYTHQEALETFKNLRRGIVTLKVKRSSSETPNLSAFTTPRTSPGSSPWNSKDVTEDSSSNSSSPTMMRKIRQRRSKKQKNVEVVLFKEPGSSLGIGLGHSDPLGSSQQQGIFVQCIIEGTAAHKDGRLRKGDQLLKVNDRKLADLSVENVYDILDKLPSGKTCIKVFQREMSERIPSHVNDALLKLQSERRLLDKKLGNKGMSVGPASTLSGASGSLDSSDNMSSLSSSSEPLIPPIAQQKKRNKLYAVQKSEAVLPSHDSAVAEATEDIYTILKQPTGELGMGVRIDKSRGSTKVEDVSVKSINDGGAADRAKSISGVGLRPGDHIIEVNGAHLKGMDQEDVIKIFRDLPSSTLMKISRSQIDSVRGQDSLLQTSVKENASVEKTPSRDQAEHLTHTIPPVGKQRSLLRNRMQTSQGEKYSPSTRAGFNKEKSFSCVRTDTFQDKKDLGNDRQAQGKTVEHNQEQYLNNVEQEDEISIPNGFRKITVRIRKPANSSLGLSLVPSHGKLKGYFQIRRLLSGMVCAQDGQLCVGDRILSVNGLPLKGVTHSMALQLLKKPTEMVMFVVLREGVDTQEDLSLNFPSKPHFGSLYEPSSSSEKRKQPLQTNPTLIDCSVQSVESNQSQSEHQQNDNAQDLPGGVGYSSPSPPVLDLDSLVDGSHGFVPPPSFSPPPPPLLENSSLETKEDTIIPVVYPPPELSPRMKNLLTQDLFKPDAFHGEHEMDHKSRNGVINQRLCKGNNCPPGRTITMADNQWSLTSSATPNESGDMSNQQSVDIHDSSGNLFIHSSVHPVDNKFVNENASDKKVSSEPFQKSVNSIPLPVERNSEMSAVVGHDLSSATGAKSLLSLTQTGQSEGEERHQPTVAGYYKENKVENWTDQNSGDKDGFDASIENTEQSDAMEPVGGRRVDNVPFLIVYQKKFRSLGIKVELSAEGKVVLTEVSSFGLVGKDGNVRVGDIILSLNDISLDGMHIEEVRNLIKNCPRGDVRVVACSRPKTTHLPEVERDISLQQSTKHYGLQFAPDQVYNSLPEKMQFSSNEDELKDVLLGSEFRTFNVGLPREFVSPNISGIAGNTPTQLEVNEEKHLSNVVPTSYPPLIIDNSVATNECSDMFDINVNDSPPSTPPPPVPEENQVSKVESSLTSLDETLVKNTIQDVSIHSWTPEDSINEVQIGSFPDLNSEAEKIPHHDTPLHKYDSSISRPRTGTPNDHLIYPHVLLKSTSDLQEKQTFSGTLCLESDLWQIPLEEEEQTSPLKPPSLFGDDTEVLPAVSTANVLSTWNPVHDQHERQDSLLKPPSLFGDDTEGPPAVVSLPKTKKDVLEEQIAEVNESTWDTEDKLSIKPPSLFADELIGVVCAPLTSASLEQDNHSTAQVTIPIVDKTTTSELEITQSSAYKLVNPVVGASSLVVPEDDMSSLPPAPPPPSKRVHRSSSWSISSSFGKDPVSHRNEEYVHNNSHLQPAVKTEQKKSKKRMLPLRVRSKRGRKASEEFQVEFQAEHAHEGLSHIISVDDDIAVTSSGDASKPPLLERHTEPPEDDMESLPPAPPPPRVSPEHTSPVRSGAKNYPHLPNSSHKQDVIMTSLSQPQEDQLSLKCWNPSHRHPKRESFCKTAVYADIEDLVPESSPLDSSSGEVQITHGNLVDSSESQDPTTLPPLPPQVELLSAVGSAEAELALLDQILTLEDSSKSGNEQSSEEGNLSLGKGGSSQKGVLSLNKIPRQIEKRPLLAGYQNTYPAETLSLEKNSSEESSLVLSHNIGDGLPDSNAKASTSSKEGNQDKESYSAILPEKQGQVDLQDMPNTSSVDDKTSEIAEGAKTIVKQRRPAPPIPIRLPEGVKTATLPNKPVAANLISGAVPTAGQAAMKAVTLPNQQKAVLTPSLLQKEDESSLPAVQDTTYKNQSRKNQKGKKKDVDPQTIPGQESLEGKSERSRSWTKRLFGFRSRSKSSDKSNNKKMRTRSVSPPRGILPKSKGSIVPPPLPSNEKSPLSEKSRESVEKNLKKGRAEENQSPDKEIPLPKSLSSEPSPKKKTDKRLNDCPNKVQNTKLSSSLPDYDPAQSSFDSNFLVEAIGVTLATELVTQEDIYGKESGDVVYLDEVTMTSTNNRKPCAVTEETNLTTLDVNEIPMSDNSHPLPNHAKPLPTTQFVQFDRKEGNTIQDNMHLNVAVKPPVSKKPQVFKAVSLLASEQGYGVKDKKQKLDKVLSLDSAHGTISTFTDDTSRLQASYSEDVSLPGRPRIKPLPLVLEKEIHENKINLDEIKHSPSSPGPPNFKPPPPPGVTIQKPSETEVCPQETSQAKTQECIEDSSSQRFVGQRKMKPLPPIPNDFIQKAKEEREAEKDSLIRSKPFNQKIPQLSRQYAQEQYDTDESCESHASVEKENWLLEVSPAHSSTSELYDPSSQVSELEQPLNVPPNASGSHDFIYSEPLPEWEDSTSQENLTSSPVNSKLVKSASFSVGDHPIKPMPGEDDQQKPVPSSIPPPPLMHRRSSSLPGFPAEPEQRQQGPEITNYWHTGNIQELINSRNKEPDVDEGVIEVQLLKEQQSIGLMVVGGLDTHLGMLYVKDIQPGSPAAKCGRLRTGDQLLQVNDQCLVGVNHGEALNILKNTPPLVKLTVARKQDTGESASLELAAEGKQTLECDRPIVSTAHDSSTISKTSSELTLSPPSERALRPRSGVLLSSFGTLVNDEQQPGPMYSSLEDPDEYIPAFLEPESPTLMLRQDDVPVTVIDGIPDEQGEAEEEEQTRQLNKSVSWAVTNDDGGKVFTVELHKGDQAGLGMSVSGGVETACENVMVRQILSSSVTAHDGRIKKGDILLSVNGKSFKGLTNGEALTLLKETREHVTLVLYRPKGPRQGMRSAMHFKDKNRQGTHPDSDAWPTKDEMTKKKNHANKRNTPPALETIPLDITKQNGDNSMYERVKKRLFPNGRSKGLKERLHKAPQVPTICEITLDKGASGLGFSLAGGQDSLYGDAPIQVKYVFKESVAGKSGALKPGDEIMEVNGQRVSYMTHVDALELIKRLPYGPVVMKIRRL